MIIYFDASALVKRYVAEVGSASVERLVGQAEVAGTAVITRAEVAAALAKAVRIGLLGKEEASLALRVFNGEWENFVRIQMTEVVISRAAILAWDYGLRGYDAVHLASALFWQDMLGESIVVASFDRELWEATRLAGLTSWPEKLIKKGGA
jgi:predicted nucleic acid-binding protein